MTKIKRHIIFLLSLIAFLVPINAFAQENDTITTTEQKQHLQSRWDRLMTWNYMALPYASYTPETSFNFGLSGVGYFKMPKTSQYSDLTLEGGYSTANRWYLHVNSRLNFQMKRRWFTDLRVFIRHQPDWFFGIGSNTEQILETPIKINEDFIYFNVHPQVYLTKQLIVGVSMNYRYSNTTTATSLDSLENHSSIAGFGDMHLLGLGANISYDSRSNTYYPLDGLFFKTHAIYYASLNDRSCNMVSIDTDFRAFLPLYKQLVLALQCKMQWTIGDNKPYQLMPTLGGQDMLRGIRENMWKNDALIAVQTELRIPIWKFLKGAAFVSAGDVYSLSDWTWNKLKVGYGVGLRACIHEARMNIRFDVARQNYGDNWSFYFTVKEAF